MKRPLLPMVVLVIYRAAFPIAESVGGILWFLIQWANVDSIGSRSGLLKPNVVEQMSALLLTLLPLRLQDNTTVTSMSTLTPRRIQKRRFPLH